MNKIYKTIGCAFMLTATMTISAQQLPNGGFDEAWVDCVPWISSGNTKALGVQPSNWCVSNVIGMKVLTMWMGSTTIASQVSGGYDGSAYAVNLKNVINEYKKSEVVPGYMTLGTTWSTSLGAEAKNKDGGSYGGIEFTYKPDAVSFYYQRTHGTGTDATYNASEPATVVAYLWKGTWSQADVPANIGLTKVTKATLIDRERNILGMTTDQGGTVTKTDDAELIASLTYYIEGDATEWTRFIQPLNYVSTSTPAKLNVIVAANDYFSSSNIGADNSIIVDNMSLVYYSRLSALSIGDVAVDGFSSDVYSYTMSGTTLPTEDQITATVMGQSATKTVAIDAENATVTITVSNVDKDIDGLASHSYVLQYEKAPAGETKQYGGYLNIKCDMLGGVLAEDQENTITIVENGDGTCTFTLPNFYLDTDYLGDIVVENVVMTEEEGKTVYNGTKEGLELNGGIVADVVISGTITDAGVVDMLINVDWMGVPIVCTFTTKPAGIESNFVTDAELNAPVEYYNLQGVKVANPENGVYIRVQGNKATKVLVK